LPAKGKRWLVPVIVGACVAFVLLIAVASRSTRTKPNGSDSGGKKKAGGAYETAMTEGKAALQDEKWDDAKAAFERALKKKKDDPKALRGLAASQAGSRAARFLSQALKALEEGRFELAEEHLETIEWLREGGEPVLQLVPSLREALRGVRKRIGEGMLAALRKAAPLRDGKMLVSDRQEAFYRWAKGLLRATGSSPDQQAALTEKLPELFRMGAMPGANILFYAGNLEQTEGRLKSAGPGVTVTGLLNQGDKRIDRTVNWSQPFLVALRVPPVWALNKEPMKFGVRLSPAGGQEIALRRVVGWYSFFLSGGRPKSVIHELSADPWSFTNSLTWNSQLRSFPSETARRSWQRDPADLRVNLRVRKWIKESNRRESLRALPWKREDLRNWAFLVSQTRDLEEVAVKAQVRPGHVWIRGRFFPASDSELHQRLGKDSPILHMGGFRFLPRDALMALCVSAHTFLFSSFIEDFLTRMPLGDAKDRLRADEARRRTVGLASAALKACGPQAVAALVPPSGQQPWYVLVVADLVDGQPDLARLEKDLKKFISSGDLWDELTKSDADRAAGEPKRWKPVPETRHGSVAIRGLRAVGAQDEVRFAANEGRLFLAASEHGAVLRPLMEALDRAGGARSDSVTEVPWFRQAMGKLPRHAGTKLVFNAKPDDSRGTEIISFFSRVLDGTWDCGLRLPVENLKDIKPAAAKLKPAPQKRQHQWPEKRPIHRPEKRPVERPKKPLRNWRSKRPR
jgi:hypothetical protein